jgi:hypothetical protein
MKEIEFSRWLFWGTLSNPPNTFWGISILWKLTVALLYFTRCSINYRFVLSIFHRNIGESKAVCECYFRKYFPILCTVLVHCLFGVWLEMCFSFGSKQGVKAGMYIIDTFQDFFIAEDMKPRMHILEISISSLNHVIARPTKTPKLADKKCA